MTSRIKMLLASGNTLGPYFLLEILLPGGTLVAILYWLYRRWGKSDWGLGPGDWGLEMRDVEHGLAAGE